MGHRPAEGLDHPTTTDSLTRKEIQEGIRSRNKKTANKDVINRIIPSFERKRHSSLFYVYRAGKMDWRSIGERRLAILVEGVAR